MDLYWAVFVQFVPPLFQKFSSLQVSFVPFWCFSLVSPFSSSIFLSILLWLINVCFKKTGTKPSSNTLLGFVPFFLKQTLLHPKHSTDKITVTNNTFKLKNTNFINVTIKGNWHGLFSICKMLQTYKIIGSAPKTYLLNL